MTAGAVNARISTSRWPSNRVPLLTRSASRYPGWHISSLTPSGKRPRMSRMPCSVQKPGLAKDRKSERETAARPSPASPQKHWRTGNDAPHQILLDQPRFGSFPLPQQSWQGGRNFPRAAYARNRELLSQADDNRPKRPAKHARAYVRRGGSANAGAKDFGDLPPKLGFYFREIDLARHQSPQQASLGSNAAAHYDRRDWEFSARGETGLPAVRFKCTPIPSRGARRLMDTAASNAAPFAMSVVLVTIPSLCASIMPAAHRLGESKIVRVDNELPHS